MIRLDKFSFFLYLITMEEIITNTADVKRKALIKLLVKEAKKKKPKSMYKLMLEAGFAESTARVPQVITGRMRFQKLLNQYLSPDKALTAINELVSDKNKHASSRFKSAELILKLHGFLDEKEKKKKPLMDDIGDIYEEGEYNEE